MNQPIFGSKRVISTLHVSPIYVSHPPLSNIEEWAHEALVKNSSPFHALYMRTQPEDLTYCYSCTPSICVRFGMCLRAQVKCLDQLVECSPFIQLTKYSKVKKTNVVSYVIGYVAGMWHSVFFVGFPCHAGTKVLDLNYFTTR